MMLMVTSPWHHPSLHPHGLVLNSNCLWRQYRGDWSQPMANRTSKSDSNTFASEEHHYSFSLTTDMNCISLNPRVPVAKQETYFGSGVRVYNICFWLFVNSFLSPANGFSWKRRWSMANVGIHSYDISTKASSTSSEHRITGIQVPPVLLRIIRE